MNNSFWDDAVVYDGKGSFDIYGYPEEVFLPTDFHTATLVGSYIYIIGNLGYGKNMVAGDTPIYRLDTKTWKMERVTSSGEKPGWIGRHDAKLLDPRRIEISGGQVAVVGAEGRYDLEPNPAVFILDLKKFVWTKKIEESR